MHLKGILEAANFFSASGNLILTANSEGCKICLLIIVLIFKSLRTIHSAVFIYTRVIYVFFFVTLLAHNLIQIPKFVIIKYMLRCKAN